MSRRIPGIPNVWQEYITCLLFHMLLPLLPLVFEFYYKDKISALSATLAAAMYCISIGLSSKNKVIFSISIMICIFYSVKYGSLLNVSDISTEDDGYALMVIIFMFITHAFERYNIHVADSTPFFTFAESEVS